MIAKLKTDYAAVDTENRKEISSLREELDRLKGLLNEGSGSSSGHPGKSL
jgi:hypothetical protein